MENNAPNYGLSKMRVDTYGDETFVNPLLRALEKDLLLGIHIPKQQTSMKNKME